MNKTKIEYLDYSWNPIAMRCTPVSEGCQNCWHLATNKRFNLHTGLPELREKELNAPLKLKKSSIIGVQFMGDLFHGAVNPSWLTDIFQVIAESIHTFIILTKRPRNMLFFYEEYIKEQVRLPDNAYFGVTTENQKRADERIPILLQIPAAKRFVSIEPMLEPINNLSKYLDYLDWVILGAESGPGARPMQEAWAQAVAEQCFFSWVPFFFKQTMVNGKLVKMPELDGKVWDEYFNSG